MKRLILVLGRLVVVALITTLIVGLPTSASAAYSTYSTGWLDEITKYVLMEKAITPQGNFEPYLDQLRSLRDAVDKGDWVKTRRTMADFMNMLEVQAGGLPKATAKAIWDYCYRTVPMSLHTDEDNIRAMGYDAYRAYQDRQDRMEWIASHSF
jgi:hypothetical protein